MAPDNATEPPSEDPATAAQLRRLAEKFELTHQQAIVSNIAELFTPEEVRLSNHERSLMESTLAKFIHVLEMRIRRDLAARLEALAAAPAALLQLLPNDEIEMARPLLMSGRLLRDPELIEIVKHRCQEHLLTMALRRALSPALTEMLTDYGAKEVVKDLLKHPDAVLSLRAFDYLVAEARQTDRFQEPILEQADLPVDLAGRLLWRVSGTLRRVVAKCVEIDTTLLDDVLQDVTRRALSETQLPSVWREAARLAKEVADSDGLDDRYLLQILRTGKIPAFLAALAQRGGLSQNAARRVVFDLSGETLAVACRAIGMDRTIFSVVCVLVRQGRQGILHPQKLQKIMEFFDAAPISQARKVVRFWSADHEYLAVIGKLPQSNGSSEQE